MLMSHRHLLACRRLHLLFVCGSSMSVRDHTADHVMLLSQPSYPAHCCLSNDKFTTHTARRVYVRTVHSSVSSTASCSRLFKKLQIIFELVM